MNEFYFMHSSCKEVCMFSHIFKSFKKQRTIDTYNYNKVDSETAHELTQAHFFEENSIKASRLSRLISLQENQDARNAIWYYLRAALRGDKEAQYKMGLSYLNGQLGLDRSYIHAEEWLKKAAHQGHIEAKAELQKAFNQLTIS